MPSQPKNHREGSADDRKTWGDDAEACSDDGQSCGHDRETSNNDCQNDNHNNHDDICYFDFQCLLDRELIRSGIWSNDRPTDKNAFLLTFQAQFGDWSNPPTPPPEFADLDIFSMLPPSTITANCAAGLSNYPCLNPQGGDAIFTTSNDGFWVTSITAQTAGTGVYLDIWDGDTGIVNQNILLDPSAGWRTFDFEFLAPTGNAIFEPTPYGMQWGISVEKFTVCRDANQRAGAPTSRRRMLPRRHAKRDMIEGFTAMSTFLRWLGLA